MGKQWAIQMFFGTPSGARQAIIAGLARGRIDSKILREEDIACETGIPREVVALAVRSGLGTVNTLSRLASLLGLRLRDLIPIVGVPSEKVREVRRRMADSGAGIGGTLSVEGGDMVPVDDEMEMTLFVSTRVIDEIEELYFDHVKK